mmetsp:Transcript_86424/g.231515  ORF Transcript_86424/g.231515 Transcript_86424/m.231515 type:complete len:241 (+) Transcript_86424:195-917(+)
MDCCSQTTPAGIQVDSVSPNSVSPSSCVGLCSTSSSASALSSPRLSPTLAVGVTLPEPMDRLLLPMRRAAPLPFHPARGTTISQEGPGAGNRLSCSRRKSSQLDGPSPGPSAGAGAPASAAPCPRSTPSAPCLRPAPSTALGSLPEPRAGDNLRGRCAAGCGGVLVTPKVGDRGDACLSPPPCSTVASAGSPAPPAELGDKGGVAVRLSASNCSVEVSVEDRPSTASGGGRLCVVWFCVV